MAKFVSSAEALTQINQRLSRPISKQQFRTIYILMQEYGIATPVQSRQSGWILSEELWKWTVYMVTRESLISAGKWSSNRPYSVADMEDISIVGMYDDYQPGENNSDNQKS